MEELRKLEQSRILITFLEEASRWVSLETDVRDSEEINNPPTDCLSLQINHEEVAMVGVEAMERANSTLEDFALMFVGLQILFYVSLNGNKQPTSDTQIFPCAFIHRKLYLSGVTALAKEFEKVKYQGWAEIFVNLLEKDPFRPLLSMLECRGLLTER
ncbi:hypothetical protein CRYUN_Cryun24cG0038400 [Craigia yunnanensis]